MIRAASVLALAAAAAVPFVQARVDAALGDFRAQNEVLYLWKGSQVKRLVPGFEHLAADIYWLRTVQYFGGERVFAKDKRFDLLYPLIEITTTLDPRMEIAYRYGAVFLAEPVPIGAGRPDLGVAVLERGVRNNPASWRLHQELGFFHFVYLHDAKRAAEILVEASQHPGGRLLAQEPRRGDPRQGRREGHRPAHVARDVRAVRGGDQGERAHPPHGPRRRRRRRPPERARSRSSASASGRLPRDLGELAAAGLARGPLVDPIGIPFEYDAQTRQGGRLAHVLPSPG